MFIVVIGTFAWASGRIIRGSNKEYAFVWQVYELESPLFWGSVLHFRDLFDPKNDSQGLVIDFNEPRVWVQLVLMQLMVWRTSTNSRAKVTHPIY